MKYATPAIVLDTEELADTDHQRGHRTKYMLLGRHVHHDEYGKSSIVGLDSRDAILIVIDKVAYQVGLRLIWSDKQEVDVTRNGEVIPAVVILEQKVGVRASVVEKLVYEVHGLRLTPEIRGKFRKAEIFPLIE